MDVVNELDENGKISNLLDPDADKKPFNESRKRGQTLRAKMAFYFYFHKLKNSCSEFRLTSSFSISRLAFPATRTTACRAAHWHWHHGGN
ncbi:hypothetical protein Hanom_Chr04g00383291 [Helianthus anomalus]